MPALLNTTSSPPRASRVAATPASTLVSSVTSILSTVTPWVSRDRATSVFLLTGVRIVPATRCPRATSARQVAWPTAPLAPVTRMRLGAGWELVVVIGSPGWFSMPARLRTALACVLPHPPQDVPDPLSHGDFG